MTFPLSWSGSIPIASETPSTGRSQALLGDLAAVLRAGGAIVRAEHDRQLEFELSLGRIMSQPNWDHLSAISSGVVRLEEAHDTLRFTWSISFKRQVLVASGLIFGWMAPIVLALGAIRTAGPWILAFWILSMSANYLLGVAGFRATIRRVVGPAGAKIAPTKAGSDLA